MPTTEPNESVECDSDSEDDDRGMWYDYQLQPQREDTLSSNVAPVSLDLYMAGLSDGDFADQTLNASALQQPSIHNLPDLVELPVDSEDMAETQELGAALVEEGAVVAHPHTQGNFVPCLI